MVFTTGSGAKKSKRLNAIVALKRAAAALQYVYVIGLAHKPLLFLVANLRDTFRSEIKEKWVFLFVSLTYFVILQAKSKTNI